MTPAEKQITQLYVGYFGRAPDRPGFDFWLAQANAGGSLLDIANAFAQSPEYQSMYGGLNNGALIDAIYANLFDRAADAEGKAYWLNELQNGMSAGALIVNIINGAQGADKLMIENAAIVANDWMVSNQHLPFDTAAAKNAIDSINESQGDGLNLIFTDAAQPYQNQITAAAKAAWAQLDAHSPVHARADIEFDFLDLGNNVLAFAEARMEALTAQTYYGTNVTQTGLALELTTGRDPNGDLPDGRITIAMNMTAFDTYDLASVLAHEFLHILGFRTEAFDFDGIYGITTWDAWLSFPNGTTGPAFFNGPRAIEAYGGPVPLVGYYNATHTVYGGVMDPSFGAYEVKSVGLVEIAMLADLGITVT